MAWWILEIQRRKEQLERLVTRRGNGRNCKFWNYEKKIFGWNLPSFLLIPLNLDFKFLFKVFLDNTNRVMLNFKDTSIWLAQNLKSGWYIYFLFQMNIEFWICCQIIKKKCREFQGYAHFFRALFLCWIIGE